MRLPFYNRALLRAWLASAVLLAGATACSRSDKADTGSSQDQTGAAGTVDTLMVADSQSSVAPAPAETQAAPGDSAVSSEDTATMRQPVARVTGGERTQPAAAAPTSDSSVSGYQAMTGDTADRIRPPEDSSETLGAVTTNDSVAVSGDTVTSSTEMVRDTSTILAQADTSVEVEVDTTTAVTDSATQVAADTTTAIQAQVDTTSMDQEAEVAVETPADTAAVATDSSEIEKTGERLEPSVATAEAQADTLADETGRIRPPEDSTEVYGNVTEDQQKHEDVEAAPDQAPAAGAGVQTSGETITGAAAVAQTTREGQRCSVVEGEESEQDIRWDLASSPATMNPCGTGTMTLPRIQTEK